MLLPALAVGQQVGATGSVVGTVHDPSGALVPDANVEIEHRTRGIKRTATTDQDGIFTIQALPPAEGYTVTIAKEGFAAYELFGVAVQVGENTPLAITLSISAFGTRVSVDEAGAVANASKIGVSEVVNSSQVLNLPINGRRVDTYVLLTPGVVADGVQGLVSFRGLAGGNVFLTDGNDTSNQFFHENAGRTRVYTQISQDAVQQFQVLSSGYSAEYGRASGGIINTVTRSGSNVFHGTVYWFFRNRTLDARDPHSYVNPPEKRSQVGGSVSGRILKDQLFYFFNSEVHRRSFPLVASIAVPPLFDPSGNFIGGCDMSPGKATPQECAAAIGFLNRQFQVLPRSADSELLFGKLDWMPSIRHRVSASFNYLRWISPNGYQTQAVLNDGSGVGDNGSSNVHTRYGRVSWTWLPSSNKVNELRFGWFKDRHADNLNPALTPSTGLVQITVEGQSNLGVSSDLPRLDPSENRFQLADTLFMTHGRHNLKFGADFINNQDYLRYLADGSGSYDYADFTSFAQDFSGNVTNARRWSTYSQRFGANVFNSTIRDYDVFAEDQFRVAPNVNLNLGMRYEISSLPQPPQGNPDYPDSAHIPSSKTNFGPRVGGSVALNQGRTVVRGGYGIFYSRYSSGVVSTFFLENGVYQQSVVLDTRFLSSPLFGPVFPNALPAYDPNNLPGPSNPNFTSAIDLTIPSKDYRNPYSQQSDMGVEQAITPTLNVSASWLWNRGIHLTTVRDLNIGPPGANVTYTILDAAGQKVGTYVTPGYRVVNRVNPNWRRVNSVESGGNSYYDGLVLQVRKRLAHGFEGFLAYTWSHAIDFNQGGGADNIFFDTGPRSLYNGDYRGDKASSQLDQRHRLVISSTWDPKARHLLLSNWRLSQISTFASSQPATAAVFVQGVPFPGAAFNTTLDGFGGSTRVPFLPASNLDIGRIIRTDARLTRLIRVSEHTELHLNFEAFNVFNHVSTTGVNTLAYVASNQVLRPAPGLGAAIASQGYPDGTNARRAQLSIRYQW
jgi:hypothetical protein